MPYNKPFIDFHTHMFPDRLHRAIVEWFEREVDWHWTFREGYVKVIEYLEAMPGLKRYLTFGYAHKPGIARGLNRFYAEVGKLSPKAVPLFCAHQGDEDLAGLAEEAFALGLKGVKLHCQVQKASPSDPRFFPLYERVEANGGIALLHAGNGPMTGEFVGFEHTLPLLDRFPGLTVVVAHLGAFQADLFLKESMKRPNLFLDTSYTFIKNPSNLLDAPVELLAEAYEKVLYASDFPGICHTYEAGVEAILSLGLPEEKLDAIFYGNAEKLLKKMGVAP